VLDILTELYRSGRLRVHWAVDGAQPRPCVKLAFLLLQCLESAMPYGGQVRISADATGWLVQGEADKLRLEPVMWDLLSGGAAPQDLRPSQVHFALVPLAVARQRRRLEIETGETRIVARARPARAA
jgi:histidine phosphotransferase ChpT